MLSIWIFTSQPEMRKILKLGLENEGLTYTRVNTVWGADKIDFQAISKLNRKSTISRIPYFFNLEL